MYSAKLCLWSWTWWGLPFSWAISDFNSCCRKHNTDTQQVHNLLGKLSSMTLAVSACHQTFRADDLIIQPSWLLILTIKHKYDITLDSVSANLCMADTNKHIILPWNKWVLWFAESRLTWLFTIFLIDGNWGAILLVAETGIGYVLFGKGAGREKMPTTMKTEPNSQDVCDSWAGSKMCVLTSPECQNTKVRAMEL